MAKIVITGGTGFIGTHLTNHLQNKGYEVAILSRNPKKKNEFRWNITEKYIDEKALINATHIIHLAGAGIAEKRWTTKRKEVLINSRTASTTLLFNKVKELQIPLEKFISASGIGFYGAITSDKIFTENNKPHHDFISKICVAWENTAKQFETLNIPITILRTGIVLAKNGGALQKMNTPLFLSVLGNGKQYMPWIHITDLCNLYTKAIEDATFKGIYNGVANNQTNIAFTKELGKVLNKPVLPINVPVFVLKTIFGEMAQILLEGSKISTEKISEKYSFKFNDLKTAFANIVK